VEFLLDSGFSLDDIELEKYEKGNTDVYANNGDVEAYIECETMFHETYGSWSGSYSDGKAIYIVSPGWLYLIGTTMVPSYHSSSDPFETVEFRKITPTKELWRGREPDDLAVQLMREAGLR